MPIYEYKCNACGEHTELVQKFSDEPATLCPHCHENELQKLVSAAAFHLKGSGWYVTDFKDNKNKTQDKDNKKEDNKSSTTATAKDSKKDEQKTKDH